MCCVHWCYATEFRPPVTVKPPPDYRPVFAGSPSHGTGRGQGGGDACTTNKRKQISGEGKIYAILLLGLCDLLASLVLV